MVTNTPRELLDAYADMAEQSPLTMKTEAGRLFQKQFLAVQRMAALEKATAGDLIADIAAVTARHLISMNMARHEGEVCLECAFAHLQALMRAAQDEINTMLSESSERNPQRLN